MIKKAPLRYFILLLILCSLSYMALQGGGVLSSPVEQHILIHLRLPVLVTAIIVGASLSVSAACLQVLLANPLADPGMIGISSGASLMAAVLLLTPLAVYADIPYVLSAICFIGALGSSFLIFYLAKKLQHSTSAVILAGIGFSTVAGAVIGWLYLIAPPNAMRNLTFWLMGSLHSADNTILAFVVPVLMTLIIYLCRDAKKFNWLYLGEVSAQINGIDTNKFNRKTLVICAVLVGFSVSIAGSIAFIGLLVPHILRLWLGHDNRVIIPCSAVSGAIILVLVAIANDVTTDVIVPVSMLTATVGGPLFIWSLMKMQRV